MTMVVDWVAYRHTQPFTNAWVALWYESLVMFAVFVILTMLLTVGVMWLTTYLCKREWCYGDPANKYKDEKSQVTDRYDASYQPHNFIADEDEDDDDDDADVDHAGAKGTRGECRHRGNGAAEMKDTERYRFIECIRRLTNTCIVYKMCTPVRHPQASSRWNGPANARADVGPVSPSSSH
jgi:hypothetical protein